MTNRRSLHELIDTLPEGALEPTERILRNYQTWPPKSRIDVENMHKRAEELLRRTALERTAQTGTGIVTARFSGQSSQPDGDAMASTTTMDGPTLVNFEIRIFRGHRLELEERLSLSEDKKTLLYAQQIKGPQGKENRYEVLFDVPERPAPSSP